MTITQIRQPKGLPVGGQFAAGQRPGADITLDSSADAQQAPQVPEREQAYTDFSTAGQREVEAATLVATYELALVAQLALEDGYHREDTLILAASGDTGLVALEVAPADDSAESDTLPSEWSEDLCSVTAQMYDGHPLLTRDPYAHPGEGDRYEMVIGDALDAELEALGDGYAHTGTYLRRRIDAWQAYSAARNDRVLAAAHVMTCDAEEIPGARGLVLAATDDRDGLQIVGVRDEDGHLITAEDATSFADYSDNLLEETTTQEVLASGAGRLDGMDQVDISFDAVRRLRGTADDPAQGDIFGEDTDLAAFGWWGAAGA